MEYQNALDAIRVIDQRIVDLQADLDAAHRYMRPLADIREICVAIENYRASRAAFVDKARAARAARAA